MLMSSNLQEHEDSNPQIRIPVLVNLLNGTVNFDSTSTYFKNMFSKIPKFRDIFRNSGSAAFADQIGNLYVKIDRVDL